MKTLLRIGMLLLALGSTSCASLLQTEPFVRGTIVDVGNGWLDVRHKSGRVVRIPIPVTINADAPKPGSRALVILNAPSGTSFMAREIRVFANP